MAAQQPGVWGIDVGQCALKAIRLEQKEGQVVATAFDYIEHPKILSQPDADPDQLTREALEQFLSRNTIRGDMVVISVPGQSGLARFVKLPPVEEKKIADIVRFEAKQQIPFPLEEVVWDFQKLSSGSLDGGDFVETEIGLFAMKRDLVNRALQQFKDAAVEVHIVQMAPLALCNYLAYDLLGKAADGAAPPLAEGEAAPEGKLCVVALDIGTDNSNLVITDGDKIIWQRPIPLGGNHFTRALTKDLKLTFAKAEHLKRNAAKSPDLKKILASLKSVLNDFVGEVQRSLGYFTNTHRDAQIQYMIGLGNACRLPGLQKFLQEKLQLEVRKMSGLQRATGEAVTAAPTFTENVMGFAVAYGLALQGLKLTRLQTNLLPYEVRLERLIRAKKPWALVSAACLLLAVAGLAFAKGIEKAAVMKPQIKEWTKKGEGLQSTISKNLVDYKAKEKEFDDALAVLNRIGAGVKERLNWQLLQEYINMALPLPNGERLRDVSERLEPVKAKYWTKEAQEAFVRLERLRFQQAGEVSAEKQKKDEEFIKKNLIQVNIEGISSLFSDDLGPYFRNIHAAGDILQGMFEDEKREVVAFVKPGGGGGAPGEPTPASGGGAKGNLTRPGWVVEVRGYTYHSDGMKFIENTIIENLRYLDKLKGPDGKDIKLPKDMDELIRSRISHLFIYKWEKVDNPRPGQFQLIGRSHLSSMVRDGGGGGGPGGPMMPPGGPPPGPGGVSGPPPGPSGDPAGGGAAKANRDGWRAIGEVASTEGGGLGAAGPAGPMGPRGFSPPAGPVMPSAPGNTAAPATAEASQPRVEFIVFFVWREPLSTDAPAAPEEKK